MILPVRNAETQLAQRVNELIEIVSELTDDIELLIVDDGSTDSTEEVANELCRVYPQVDYARHSPSIGLSAAAQLGIDRTTGDVIFVHDVESSVSGGAIRALWSMHGDEELVIARSELAHRNLGPRPELVKLGVGTQLLRRQTVDELVGSHSPATIIDRITRNDLGATSSSVSTHTSAPGLATSWDR